MLTLVSICHNILRFVPLPFSHVFKVLCLHLFMEFIKLKASAFSLVSVRMKTRMSAAGFPHAAAKNNTPKKRSGKAHGGQTQNRVGGDALPVKQQSAEKKEKR